MHDVIIVGAGLAGLTCARALRAKGADCLVLEAGDAVGGRVRTDEVDGFKLDRGFQVLLTAYPAARAWLDYEALQLGAFAPGALVATADGLARISDPLREPWRLFETLRAPVGSLADKLRIGRLRFAATSGVLDEVWTRGAGRSTEQELAARGFSPRMTERFLRPWLGGIFLESDLATPAAMMFFVYRMFAEGKAVLPAGGMQKIPEQLAAGLGDGALRLGARVASLHAGAVELTDGERIAAKHIVIAAESDEAARLAGEAAAGEPPRWNGTSCVYWAAPASPLAGEPVLWLNGTGRGRINHLVVPSDVAAGYAPPGQSLVSATVIGTKAPAEETDAALTLALQSELAGRFGSDVLTWRPLGVKRVRRALPVLARLASGGSARSPRPGLWVCGDHVASASAQGAMASGLATAEAILA